MWTPVRLYKHLRMTKPELDFELRGWRLLTDGGVIDSIMWGKKWSAANTLQIRRMTCFQRHSLVQCPPPPSLSHPRHISRIKKKKISRHTTKQWCHKNYVHYPDIMILTTHKCNECEICGCLVEDNIVMCSVLQRLNQGDWTFRMGCTLHPSPKKASSFTKCEVPSFANELTGRCGHNRASVFARQSRALGQNSSVATHLPET